MNRDIQAVGLDIGTSRVRCVVGEAGDNATMNIIGIGEAESRGLRRGIVTGAEAVSESVRRAISEAERVVTRAPAIEISSDGIAVTRPSPTVRMVKVARAVVTSIPYWMVPMKMPPMMLINVIRIDATASRCVKRMAPSMEP